VPVKAEVIDKIRKALAERGAYRPCSFCGKEDTWQMSNSLYFLCAQNNMPNIELNGPGMPLAAFICSNCGDTHLINLMMIGLGDLAGFVPLSK